MNILNESLNERKKNYSGIANGLAESIRLDRYIAESLQLLNRSQIKSRQLEAKLNGKPAKISRLVKNGDFLELSWLPLSPLYLKPENIVLDTIYEDSRCAVINKPQGMVVHPGAGNHCGTLANALCWRRFYKLDQHSETVSLNNSILNRNGIVHRLDKDTSGVIITAYDDETLAFLSAQFKARTARKRYLALVKGIPSAPKGRIQTTLIRDPRNRKRFTAVPGEPNGKGKTAITCYRIVKSWTDFSLVLLKPKTGRTHQLRVHLQYLGNPIIGDPVYNPLYKTDATLMLHALSLGIVLPGETEQRLFKAPIPDRFRTCIAEVKNRQRK